MRTITLYLYLIGFISLICFPVACSSGSVITSGPGKPIIRFDANGVPNFIKGENLSASLDGDPVFQNLRRCNRYGDIALYYLDSRPALFRVASARDEFMIIGISSEALGQTHIRLQQVFRSIPVWGGQVSIHLNPDNQVYFFQGHYQPIRPDLVTKPQITLETAGKLALQDRINPAQWHIQQTAVLIWAPSEKFQRLTYQVTLQRNIIYRERCFVDAIDGSVLHCLPANPDTGP